MGRVQGAAPAQIMQKNKKLRYLESQVRKEPPTPMRVLPPCPPWKLNLTSTQVNPSPLPLLGSLWGWEDLVQDPISLTRLCPLSIL